MVDNGLTDDQIGVVYGVSGASVCRARKQLRIPAQYNAQFRRKPPVCFGAPPEPPPMLVGETYVDSTGLTVTRYPARYAAGAEMQSVTARPRR